VPFGVEFNESARTIVGEPVRSAWREKWSDWVFYVLMLVIGFLLTWLPHRLSR
jgi:hypothetical protein